MNPKIAKSLIFELSKYNHVTKYIIYLRFTESESLNGKPIMAKVVFTPQQF